MMFLLHDFQRPQKTHCYVMTAWQFC